MLLYFKNIVPDFHDIDLMVADDDAARVRQILSEMGTLQPPNPNARYRTRTFLEFVIRSVDVDVMAGFSIQHDGRVYDCSLKKGADRRMDAPGGGTDPAAVSHAVESILQADGAKRKSGTDRESTFALTVFFEKLLAKKLPVCIT